MDAAGCVFGSAGGGGGAAGVDDGDDEATDAGELGWMVDDGVDVVAGAVGVVELGVIV